MTTEPEQKNIRALLSHYQDKGAVNGWGYSDCAAGVAAKLGIIDDHLNMRAFAEALGIPQHEAEDIVAGPQWSVWGDVPPNVRCEHVVTMFTGLLEGGNVVWPVAGRIRQI